MENSPFPTKHIIFGQKIELIFDQKSFMVREYVHESENLSLRLIHDELAFTKYHMIGVYGTQRFEFADDSVDNLFAVMSQAIETSAKVSPLGI
jgi:hypothetical protein